MSTDGHVPSLYSKFHAKGKFFLLKKGDGILFAVFGGTDVISIDFGALWIDNKFLHLTPYFFGCQNGKYAIQRTPGKTQGRYG